MPVPSESDPDPRWQFFSKDKHWYRSPWFAGQHQIMIGFGCNDSPWYAPDARCPGSDGFHHGIDIAMPCGTPLRAGGAGVVLAPDGPGAPGAAYGTEPFRIRVSEASGSYDVLIAHADQVMVKSGEKVRRRQRLAQASDSGAPDGCHLHFEVRPAGRGVDAAVDPSPWLQLTSD
ncbi:hypothetical protein ASD81_02045 [Nocardioides sp. Root614]|nr:hypothetical protein ASD81_02045 [Nocardioides sp. Root614]KRA91478.1 hypothetical protein ASD84_02310 [Nocardioides sp. Root682]